MDLYALKIKIKFKGNSYNKKKFGDFSNRMLTISADNLVLYFSPDIMLTKELLKKIYGVQTDYIEYLFSNSAYIKLFNKTMRGRKTRLLRKSELFTFAEVIEKLKMEGSGDIKKLNKSISQISKNITHNIKFITKLLFQKNTDFYPEINNANATVFNISKYNWPPVRRTGKININGGATTAIVGGTKIKIISGDQVVDENWYNSTEIRRQTENNLKRNIFSDIDFWVPNGVGNATSVAYPEWTYRLLQKDTVDKIARDKIKYDIKGYFYTSIDLILRKGATVTDGSAMKNFRFDCAERKRSLATQWDHILHGHEDIEDDTQLDPVLYTSDNTGYATAQNNIPQAQIVNPYPNNIQQTQIVNPYPNNIPQAQIVHPTNPTGGGRRKTRKRKRSRIKLSRTYKRKRYRQGQRR